MLTVRLNCRKNRGSSGEHMLSGGGAIDFPNHQIELYVSDKPVAQDSAWYKTCRVCLHEYLAAISSRTSCARTIGRAETLSMAFVWHNFLILSRASISVSVFISGWTQACDSFPGTTFWTECLEVHVILTVASHFLDLCLEDLYRRLVRHLMAFHCVREALKLKSRRKLFITAWSSRVYILFVTKTLDEVVMFHLCGLKIWKKGRDKNKIKNRVLIQKKMWFAFPQNLLMKT